MPDVKRVDDPRDGIQQAYDYSDQLLKVFPADIDNRVATFAFALALALQIVDEETGDIDNDYREWVTSAIDHAVKMIQGAVRAQKKGESE